MLGVSLANFQRNELMRIVKIVPVILSLKKSCPRKINSALFYGSTATVPCRWNRSEAGFQTIIIRLFWAVYQRKKPQHESCEVSCRGSRGVSVEWK